ncbi:MAG: YtxH domain-containing protein [Chloroflexota bacterium]|nr:YtxH domain-containing protein [Chloroflexota bacterium]
MADQVPPTVRSLVDKMLDPQLQEQIAERAREFVASVTEAAEAASVRAGEAWRDSAPIRQEATEQVNEAGRKALRWGSRAWRKDLQPGISRIWKSRIAALGAAGATVPIARRFAADLAPTKATEERRHWGTFFLGLLVGAAAGVIAAMLTAPKAGRQIRDDLAVSARDATVRAREAASRAREAVTAAEWMPIFPRATSEAEAPGEADGPAPVDAPAPRRATRRPPVAETETLEAESAN